MCWLSMHCCQPLIQTGDIAPGVSATMGLQPKLSNIDKLFIKKHIYIDRSTDKWINRDKEKISNYAILVRTKDFQHEKKKTNIKLKNFIANHIILNLNGK